MKEKFFNVCIVGDGESETITVEAPTQAEARAVAEYEICRARRLPSLRDAGLTIRRVRVIHPLSPTARQLALALAAADYAGMVSDLRHGG